MKRICKVCLLRIDYITGLTSRVTVEQPQPDQTETGSFADVQFSVHLPDAYSPEQVDSILETFVSGFQDQKPMQIDERVNVLMNDPVKIAKDKQEIRRFCSAGLAGEQMPQIETEKYVTPKELKNLLKGSGYSKDELRDIINDIPE